MRTTWIIIIIAGLISSCKVAEDLTFQKRDVKSELLRLDGYYYTAYESGYSTFFLYKDGTYLDEGGFLNVFSLEELDRLHKGKTHNCQNIYYCWGVYNLSKKIIKINRWLPGTGGPYPEQLLKGKILDTETIVITGLTENGTKNRTDTFRFRQFSPKPDSTNRFID